MTMIFGSTPPPPKECIVCKSKRFAWKQDEQGGRWICLDCEMPKGSNPLVYQYGPGPDGKQCRDCAHLAGICYAHTVFKCRLRQNLTHGAKTDQHKTWPACAKFEQRTGEIPLYDGRG